MQVDGEDRANIRSRHLLQKERRRYLWDLNESVWRELFFFFFLNNKSISERKKCSPSINPAAPAQLLPPKKNRNFWQSQEGNVGMLDQDSLWPWHVASITQEETTGGADCPYSSQWDAHKRMQPKARTLYCQCSGAVVVIKPCLKPPPKILEVNSEHCNGSPCKGPISNVKACLAVWAWHMLSCYRWTMYHFYMAFFHISPHFFLFFVASCIFMTALLIAKKQSIC